MTANNLHIERRQRHRRWPPLEVAIRTLRARFDAAPATDINLEATNHVFSRFFSEFQLEKRGEPLASRNKQIMTITDRKISRSQFFTLITEKYWIF